MQAGWKPRGGTIQWPPLDGGVGEPPTVSRTCPGAYLGHLSKNSYGWQKRLAKNPRLDIHDTEQAYLVDERLWGPKPQICLRLPKKYIEHG